MTISREQRACLIIDVRNAVLEILDRQRGTSMIQDDLIAAATARAFGSSLDSFVTQTEDE